MLDAFIPHFEELRRRLLVSLAVFIALSALSFFFSAPILDFLTLPLRQYGPPAVFFQKPYDAFLAHLKVSALAGFLTGSPFYIAQAWSFVTPGLYAKEKKAFTAVIATTSLLFLAGAAFSFLIVLPVSLRFLLGFETQTLKPLVGVDDYFSFLFAMVLAFGFVFNFPVVVVGLVRLGVVQTETLRRARRAVIACLFLTAAVLTPSPDPVGQIFLALPLIGLFEISLWVCRAWGPPPRPTKANPE